MANTPRLNEPALVSARNALRLRRRKRFKQLIEEQRLDVTDNELMGDARIAIEVYNASLPDLAEALGWALDKLEPFAKGHWKPGDPDWNDYKRARAILGNTRTSS